MKDNERSESCVPGCTVDTCVDHYPKAPASEVSSSDRAREIASEEWKEFFAGWHGIARLDTDDAFDRGLKLGSRDAWNHQQSIIDSQRLALEELTSDLKLANQVRDNLNAEFNQQIYELQAEIRYRDDERVVHEIVRKRNAEFSLENEQLQSRVKKLEARIQHMDNACLDNFGVTITSILD